MLNVVDWNHLSFLQKVSDNESSSLSFNFFTIHLMFCYIFHYILHSGVVHTLVSCVDLCLFLCSLFSCLSIAYFLIVCLLAVTVFIGRDVLRVCVMTVN